MFPQNILYVRNQSSTQIMMRTYQKEAEANSVGLPLAKSELFNYEINNDSNRL